MSQKQFCNIMQLFLTIWTKEENTVVWEMAPFQLIWVS